mmetsp:Transcript_38108/g.74947  ORF Transcript_38108/g.74947 Transcript_38108/m.74947 type:complete len:521 (-) Transcript_38108:239-1801(-)|eukprot:CAMPEP_0175131030 /NCGR_PEP_ID=MMETSP0087-20121206/6318_1 /TAXON_ID=136419 /ORGANISM="Unknown Unknown, Strain D1" /LENGTH=520 /DNA_ID=CAMNT_0016413279 /DNA_START=38 /DNA_END=1600 /DNA_ORIENTATION=+
MDHDYTALPNGSSINSHPSAPVAYPEAGEGKSSGNSLDLDFTATIGTMPFREPNVRSTHQKEDLHAYVNKSHETNFLLKVAMRTVCCMTGIGCCYLLSKQTLIKEGEYGIAMNNGQPELLGPGRHMLSSPFNRIIRVVSSSEDNIVVSPISIIRVPQGYVGMAINNALPEVLLPGLHVRKSAGFKFVQTSSLAEQLISCGPVKILTVVSGTVRVCYDKGKVQIFTEGRYAINSGTFVVGGIIVTQQQNVRFDKHPVLLDGGINMFVEGLLTYKVANVEKLITELGDRDLLHSIKDVTKAELARVFASIHLEQLASATSVQTDSGSSDSSSSSSSPSAVLGQQNSVRAEGAATARTAICQDVVRAVSPFVAHWGIEIVNFQLESTKIADLKYSQEYEEASLGLAKAKANRRAVELQNQIKIEQARAGNQIVLQKAQNEAEAVTIQAEGRKRAAVIQAQGEAEARLIEARARNEAAEVMTNDFAKEFALSGQKVEFAGALKATSLTVLPESAVGKPIVTTLK